LRDDLPDPGAVRAAVYAVEACLLVLVLAVCRRPFQRLVDTPEDLTRLALEGSIVLMLMLLLSPMSSKAHFGVLILPGFCLARRVIVARDGVLWTIFFLALALGMISNKDPLGDKLYSLTLWYGFTTWQTLLLLMGCLLALGRGCLSIHQALTRAPVIGPPRPEPSGRAA
jgi:hypothetical protein